MKYRSFLAAAWLLLLVMPGAGLRAQTGNVVQGTPVTGESGITLTLSEIQKRAETTLRPQGTKIREELPVKLSRKPADEALSPSWSSYPKSAEGATIQQNNTQQFHSNFAALHAFESSQVITPPDCMGDVGPTQICIASNNRFKWYAKPTVCDNPLTTSTTSGINSLGGEQVSVYIEDFFASVSGGSDVTDPHVHYDRLSERWFVVAINTASSSNRIMIAVSSGPVISSTSSFTFYQFAHDANANLADPDRGQFCDYPTLGVDKNALYIGGLIFNATEGTYIGSSAFVVRKSSLLTGGPIVYTPFRGLGSTTSGIFCAQGVNSDDPAATQGYFLGVSASDFGVLNYVVVNNPGGTPTVTQGTIDVPDTDFPDEVPALGSDQSLDAADDRLLNAVLVKNKITNSVTIWASHNIGINNTGAPALANDRVAVRWYQVGVNGSVLSLVQSGTLFDNTASRRSYWMGSISASGQGHAVVGATVAGPSDYANAAIAGRYASTAPGALFSPVQATNYAEAYNLQTDGVQRWGDYSQTVVDPSDDMTLWTFQEFTSGPNRWAVRATQLKAPPPAPVSTMTSITCTANRVVDVTVTGNAGTNFAGYFDPGADAGGPGYTRRLAVSSTGGVTISDLVFVSPTQINFKLNFAAAPSGSQQTLTITNPDCQSVTYTYNLPADCAPLPVRWLGISARWNDGKAEVQWKVAAEVNVKEYEVERSADGRNFASIGRVQANGMAGEQAYTFTDAQPGAENYYRVRQIDKDGAFAYSSVAALHRSAIAGLGLYPNPASSQVRILLPADKGTVRLLDLKGQVLTSVPVSSNTLLLDTERYARGVYLVEFMHANGKTEQEKLILR